MKKLNNFKPFLFFLELNVRRQGRLLSKAYAPELGVLPAVGQVWRNWLPHLALPRVGTDRGGTNLWLKGMNPRDAWRGQQDEFLPPSDGRSLPYSRQSMRCSMLLLERLSLHPRWDL